MSSTPCAPWRRESLDGLVEQCKGAETDEVHQAATDVGRIRAPRTDQPNVHKTCAELARGSWHGTNASGASVVSHFSSHCFEEPKYKRPYEPLL